MPDVLALAIQDDATRGWSLVTSNDWNICTCAIRKEVRNVEQFDIKEVLQILEKTFRDDYVMTKLDC